YSGYSDALAAACKTLATTYTNNVVENFEGRVVQFSFRKLKVAVPRLKNSKIKAMAAGYIYERVAGGDPLWTESVDIVSTDIINAVDSLCEELSMSVSPGKYVPALRHILQVYNEHMNSGNQMKIFLSYLIPILDILVADERA
ncbi:hypothetical protein DFQ30_001320, partial [Apophysomyces sp. BC1015]